MSASEAHTCIRDIGVLIGIFIPNENKHCRLIIKLKEILDIACFPIINDGLADYLASVVTGLSYRDSLFPNNLKSKHHILIHYPLIMRCMGPLWNMSTMRCESKNRDFKITSHVLLSQLNICKTLEIKPQLQLNHRFLCNTPVDKNKYEKGPSEKKIAWEITDARYFSSLLPIPLSENVLELQYITFKNHTIKNNVLAIPNEMDPQIFWVKVIIDDFTGNLYIIAKVISNYVLYDEHFQAYKFYEDAAMKCNSWQVIDLQSLESCFVSHIVDCRDRGKFIPKHWI